MSVDAGASDTGREGTDILVFEVLQQLQLSVRALGEDWSAEGLHDLLDGHILVGELISGRAGSVKKQLGSRHQVCGVDAGVLQWH